MGKFRKVASVTIFHGEEQKGGHSGSTERNKIHSATLMDICHLKNAELESKLQKYKGRVVLRDHIVKDDSDSDVVFTAQDSSVSQMTAAKVMDIIARLPDCARQAADAVSTYKKWRTLQNYKDSEVRVSRHVDTSSTTLMTEIVVKH